MTKRSTYYASPGFGQGGPVRVYDHHGQSFTGMLTIAEGIRIDNMETYPIPTLTITGRPDAGFYDFEYWEPINETRPKKGLRCRGCEEQEYPCGECMWPDAGGNTYTIVMLAILVLILVTAMMSFSWFAS